MAGLSQEIVVHKLKIQHDIILIKQAPRCMRLEIEQVVTKVKKLIDASFIREDKYPFWLASIVPVKKKIC